MGYLFLDHPLTLPCGDGQSAANLDLLDWNGDRSLDISDVVGGLRWQFLGGNAHILGADCRPMNGCPWKCR